MKISKTGFGTLISAFILSIAAVSTLHAQADPAPAGALDWEAPALSLPALSIAAAYAQAKGDEGDAVLVIHEKDSYRFDEKGTAAHRFHIAYKILDRNGIERWNTAVAQYQPWRQDKPEIRARVIGPDGKVTVLDQSTIAVATNRDAANDIYTDSKILDAPLPNLAIGCIVEYEIVIVDTSPISDKGSLFRLGFSRGGRISRRVLEIDRPAFLPFSLKTYGAADFIQSERKDGSRKITRVEASDVKAVRDVEASQPSGTRSYPMAEFTTGYSWADIASSYYASVSQFVGAKPPAGWITSGPATMPKSAARRALVSELLFRMQKEVRYTGINFGKNAIIPHPPADTIARGYGDCKDQSSLLVSILQANGVKARMALLLTGPAPDVPADMPGFGLFDHAIVYLPDDGVWIDPTASLTAFSVIPSADQGRLALVIDTATKGLIATTVLGPADNSFVEEIDVQLSSYGPARIVETTTMTGNLEASYRRYYARLDEKTMRERLEKYVKSQYDAESLGEASRSDPADMGKPFTLRVEAVKAGLGNSDDSAALIRLRANALFSFIPDALGSEKGDFKREKPLELADPFRVELRYRVRPSDGFKAASLPESVEESWGPCAFKAAFKQEGDGSVSATLSLDCVKKTLSPAEAKDFNKSLRAFLKADMYRIAFEQVGQSLLSAGRYRDALNEFSRLAALYPKAALHREQLSRAYLQAGFAGDALREAKAATVLEPTNARSWATLGYTRLYDPFGRMLEKGCDVEGSLKAYAEAERLDPKIRHYPYTQAIILEYGTDLRRYGEGARLDKALEAYARAAAIEKTDAITANTVVAHYKRGDWAALRSAAKEATGVKSLQSYYLAAVAALDGVQAAGREAGRIITDAQARRETLSASGQLLLNSRRYAEAADLIMENAKGARSQTEAIALANYLKSMKAFDPAAVGPDPDPVDLVRALFGYLFSSDPANAKKALSLFEKEAVSMNEQDGDAAVSQIVKLVNENLRDSEQPKEVLGDLAINMMTVTEARVGSAVAVVVDMPQIENFNRQVFYLRESGGKYLVMSGTSNLYVLGQEVWKLLESGQVDKAREWYDLIAGQGRKFPAFPSWKDQDFLKYASATAAGAAPKEAQSPADAETLRNFAAILLCGSNKKDLSAIGADRIAPLALAEKDKDRRTALARAALFACFNGERWEPGVGIARLLLADDPRDFTSIGYLLNCLDKLEKGAEADAFVDSGLAEEPEESRWHEAKARRLAIKRRYDECVGEYLAALNTGIKETGYYNNLIWFALFADKLPSDMPKDDIIVKRLMEGSAGEIQTLVCHLAKEDRIIEAQEAFKKFMSGVRGDDIDDSVWVAFGMLAESFGLRETAVDAYNRANGLSEKAEAEGSCAELAVLRLSKMGLVPATKAGSLLKK
jgi:tetratricopeptide (TPR) repeat protein